MPSSGLAVMGRSRSGPFSTTNSVGARQSRRAVCRPSAQFNPYDPARPGPPGRAGSIPVRKPALSAHLPTPLAGFPQGDPGGAHPQPAVLGAETINNALLGPRSAESRPPLGEVGMDARYSVREGRATAADRRVQPGRHPPPDTAPQPSPHRSGLEPVVRHERRPNARQRSQLLTVICLPGCNRSRPPGVSPLSGRATGRHGESGASWWSCSVLGRSIPVGRPTWISTVSTPPTSSR